MVRFKESAGINFPTESVLISISKKNADKMQNSKSAYKRPPVLSI